jgi:hypothetical protein
MVIKINYTSSDVYVSTSVSPVYVVVNYSAVNNGGGGAIWGGITGTLSDQTDLQDAIDAKFDDPSGTTSQYLRGDGSLATFPSLTGFVPYIGATANVDLGTHRILAQNATIASSGSGDTFLLNHSSGSGIGLNITKGGNGEGLYINKTSGSGNAATIIGTLNATSLVKSGGTSSQFLKADGSVDSSTYVGGSGATGQVAYWNGTSSQTGSSTLTYTPTTSLLVNNSVTAASGFGRGVNFTPTINASANDNLLIGLDIQPTFTPGIYTNTSPVGMRLYNPNTLSALDYGIQFRLQNTQTGQGNTDGFLISIDNSAAANAFLFNYENASLIFGTNGTAKARLYQTGNLVLQNGGTFSDGGQRLQVIGDAFIKGSGNTSATSGLIVQDSAGSQRFKVGNDGVVEISNRLKLNTIAGLSSGTVNIDASLSLLNSSSGSYTRIALGSQSVSSSGNFTSSGFQDNVVTNITSTSTLDYTSFLASPTLTALTAGSIYKAFGWTNNSGWGLYGAGTAPNFLGGSLTISRNHNNTTSITIENTTSGTSAQSVVSLLSDSVKYGQVGKRSTTTSAGKIIAASDTFIYNSSGSGDIAILNDNSTGKIKFSAGGSATAQATLTAAGRLLLGTTSEGTFLLDVNGTARVSGASTFSGLITASSGISVNGRIDIINDGANGVIAMTTLTNTLNLRKFVKVLGDNGAYGNNDASAAFQIDGTNRGFLPPRLTTTQKNAIASPTAGLMVFDTTLVKLCVHNGTSWETITSI